MRILRLGWMVRATCCGAWPDHGSFVPRRRVAFLAYAPARLPADRSTGWLVGAIVLLGLASGVTRDVAAQPSGIALHGWGKADCKRFLEVRRRGGHLDQTLRQWVFGYVSAYNILVAPDGDALDGANADAVIALAAAACASDPNLRISGAVNSILGGE